jgi:long-chain acyl-CoA synthetase
VKQRKPVNPQFLMSQQEATIYPYDALAAGDELDVISIEEAPTLDRVFRERVRRSADRVAYADYDFDAGRWRDYTWRQMAVEVARWQTALAGAGLRKGDHVGIRLRNCRHWVIFDQAALGLGLVIVPLYINDRADNANYVLDHAGVKLLLVGTLAEWQELDIAPGETPGVEKIIVLEACDSGSARIVSAPDWLPENAGDLARGLSEPADLASIVYTSGTTGRPKGVMLSHTNLVSNTYGGLRSIVVAPGDVLLSFLPLSHALERTVGYYAPLMAGARVAFTRSIQDLAEDLMDIRPTVLISVPRIFERIYSELDTRLEQGSAIHRILFDAATKIGWDRFQWRQGRGKWKPGFIIWPLLDRLVAKQLRDRLGGRLGLVVVGGAPLSMAISKTFIPLGINLLQGYGLTECSPILCTNTLRQNRPETIGLPLHGVRLKIGEDDELLARGPNIMMGYWRNPEATSSSFVDGWLATGDQASIGDGFISLTGRIKDILVLATGEKVPPADMESAIAEDALFEHSMVIGEQMPYLSALVVLNKQMWTSISGRLKIAGDGDDVLQSEEVEQFLLERIRKRIKEFPGYARVRHVTATLDPWTVENDLITPTLKLKRSKIRAHHEADINRMYEGHDTFRND